MNMVRDWLFAEDTRMKILRAIRFEYGACALTTIAILLLSSCGGSGETETKDVLEEVGEVSGEVLEIVEEEQCIPDCEDKVCGPDGCGGECGQCAEGDLCLVVGICLCMPQCQGKECGPSGCEDVECGVCPEDWACTADGICDCLEDCEGKECGEDGCGGSCGQCPDNHLCLEDGNCLCVPDCEGKECGDDGCSGVCGECLENWECTEAGVCDCPEKDCEGKECGADGCGGVCGECPEGQPCLEDGTCLCIPDCDGKECGDDGCAGNCGQCPEDSLCSDEGLCGCVPDCVDKICGTDGCQGTCGDCPVGHVCLESGVCLCVPACGDNECGEDGCGGTCGECAENYDCTAGEDGYQCVADCQALCDGLECGAVGVAAECECGSCDDGNLCTTDVCNSDFLCGFFPNAVACDDGNPCTGSDVCGDGECNGELLPPEEIDDIGTCLCDTDGDCLPLEDNNVCNGLLYCDLVPDVSVCAIDQSTLLDCDDGAPCTDDSCDPIDGCVNQPDETNECLDDDLCNGTETCDGDGACLPGEPLVCDDDNVCTENLCLAESGCSFDSDSQNGVDCDDDDECTEGDACAAGLCVGQQVICDDSNECTADSCDPAVGCLYAPAEGECEGGSGVCVNEECCYPDCAGLECGPDPVCGDNCGDCDEGDACEDGDCVLKGGCWPDCPPMVTVPSGTFWMGCNETLDSNCDEDEKPYHGVYLDAFDIEMTEVTQKAYQACVDAGACELSQWMTGENDWGTIVDDCVMLEPSDRPVNCIDWPKAEAYCAWAGRRLPTEAEWEKAARGSCDWYEGQGMSCETDSYVHPWGGDSPTCELAVMTYPVPPAGCGTGSTMDVCSKSPAGDSPYGLCDMSGNVYEWVSDWYAGDYYASSPLNNPPGPDSAQHRVIRGGSYNRELASEFRASYRNHMQEIDGSTLDVGFRCARSK